MLLRLSGIQERIENDFPNEWEATTRWSPESRYLSVGRIDDAGCLRMLEAVAALLEVI